MKEVKSKEVMYEALRSVKEKIDKGTLSIRNESDAIDIKEFSFLIMRVFQAVAIADADLDLQDLKYNLDQSKTC